MSVRLLLVADPELRALPADEIFRQAAASGRRIVTENIRDLRPLLQRAHASGDPIAALLPVPPGRFPRGRGRRTAAISNALLAWLAAVDAADRPDEDWLV